MLKLTTHIKSTSWMFIAAIFLATFQVTVAGYQADESSWFDLLTNVMAEEENEDSQEKDGIEEADYLTQAELKSVQDRPSTFRAYFFANPYISVVGEVTSPPPEA